MKAKLQKRLKKLELKKKTIEQEAIKINQQIKIQQARYSDKLGEALMNDGAINEFKAMLKELNIEKEIPTPAQPSKGTVKDEIGKGASP